MHLQGPNNNITNRSRTRETRRKAKEQCQAPTPSQYSHEAKSTSQSPSSPLAYAMKEMPLFGQNQLMQPTVGHQSTMKWPTPLFYAIRTALSSPQTWPDSLNPRTSPSIRNATCTITDLPPLPSNTGKIQNTPMKMPLPKPSRSGKTHAINSPSTPIFSDGWFLPAFYPVYSYQCIAGIQNFFEQAPILQPGKGKTYWKEQTQQANEMFASWEAYYYYIAAPKNTPFPKCLWYHKYHFVQLLNEPNTWRNFFHETSFAEWGRKL